MKNLKFLLAFTLSILVLSAGIISIAHTDVIATVQAVTLFQASFSIAVVLNIIPMPANVLGAYVGVGGPGGGAGVQVITTDKSRGVFMGLKTDPMFEGKTIFSSFLRLDTQLINGINNVKFLTSTGDLSAVLPSERRLDRNDSFLADRIGFLLVKQPDGKSIGQLHAYPNLQDFSAAVAADMEAIYMGRLNITIAGKRIVNGLDMQRFRKVPQTQQSAATNYDQSDLYKKLTPITPHLIIDGSANNEIEIVYPSHAGWAAGTAPAGFKHYLVMYCHGYLITQGSANT